jgi:hypothetical protein
MAGGMAARYRSGYLVSGGVEHSLTQKPWRPGNAFTWIQSTSLSAVPHSRSRGVATSYKAYG